LYLEPKWLRCQLLGAERSWLVLAGGVAASGGDVGQPTFKKASGAKANIGVFLQVHEGPWCKMHLMSFSRPSKDPLKIV